MSASHDETPDDSTLPPDDHAAPDQGTGPSADAPASDPQRGPVATPSGPAKADGPGDPIDVNAEFLRLSGELDDIPGFRFHSGPTTPVTRAQPLGTHATGPRDWPATPEVEALEDADSHFTEPDPELRLDGDPARVLGWLLVSLGVLGLLVGGILHTILPTVVLAVAGAALVIGVALLLWRMPTERGDDADTGAQV